MDLQTLIKKYRKEEPFQGKVLCLDPGGTTGTALFEHGTFLRCDQIATIDNDSQMVDYQVIHDYLTAGDFDIVVLEDYRIYQHKLKEHSFSKVPTLRLIGAIEYYCAMNNIPIHYQMAQQAKGFCTDAKLKEWNLYIKGQRHSRDAIRHGAFWLLFHK